MTTWSLDVYVVESRAAQGFPPKLEDPHALTEAARLLLAATAPQTAKRA